MAGGGGVVGVGVTVTLSVCYTCNVERQGKICMMMSFTKAVLFGIG